MYYVLTVEGCQPQTRAFKTKREVKRFLQNWVNKYGNLDDGQDNWVDKIFKGKKLETNEFVVITNDI